MRVDRVDESQRLLEETLKAAKAAQRAAESANSWLWWMNMTSWIKVVVFFLVGAGIIVAGGIAVREVKKAVAELPERVQLKPEIVIPN